MDNNKELKPVMKIEPTTRHRNNLLRIIPANIKTKNGIRTFNAIIDDGSTVTFVDSNLKNSLINIQTTPINFGVSGINGTGQDIQSEEIKLSLYNQDNKEFIIDAIVIDKINENINLPDMDFMKNTFPELKNVEFPKLANKPVQILIGLDSPEILTALKGDLYIGKGHPNVRFTPFGPALGYVVPRPAISIRSTNNFTETSNNSTLQTLPTEETQSQDEMETLIKKLINDENDIITIDPKKRLQSPKNEELEQKIRREFKKSDDGHMEVPIFWKSGKFTLRCNFKECNAFDIAQKKRITANNPQHWEHCVNELKKQVEYGAARIVDTREEDLNDGFYHPLVIIVRQSKESTPIRMCLDASRKFKQNDGKRKCFNDQMPTGTNLLNNLSDVLTNFRTKKITLFCDLTKMFFNVWVPESQTKYLRFIFDGIVYESKGWPFGLRQSPHVTCFSLKLCAEKALRAKEISQETFDYVDKHLYMDDGIFALDTEQEAIELSRQLTKVFDAVHMRFTKFGSNSKEVLQSIPENRRLTEINLQDPIPDAGTLGLRYHADEDYFTLNPVEELATKITKAEIMRIAAKVYDPNNFLGIITINARKLTQLIFQIPKQNDEDIPWTQDLEKYRSICPDLIEQITKGYQEIGQELMNVGQIKIPRLLSLGKPISSTHLIIFGDGSSIAYGACAYLRTSYNDGSVTVRLIQATKKCTPVKRQTIPRIELMAQLEAAKLASRLNKIFNPPKTTIFTDALVVLFWIKKSEIHRFDDWTQVRLTQIHELAKNSEFRHVSTSQNPADLLSRGVKLRDIYKNDEFTEKGKFWMEGPDFLKNPLEEWPRHERELQQIMTEEERNTIENSYKGFKNLLSIPTFKATTMLNTSESLQNCLNQDQCSNHPKSCLNIFRQGEKVLDSLKIQQVQWNPDQSSALKKMNHTQPLINYQRLGSIHRAARITKRVIEVCLIWLSRIKKRPTSITNYNLQQCYQNVIQHIQAEGFKKEFQNALKTQMWPVNSMLNSVNALFDQDGILRANARLSTCPGLMECERKPILLPSNHPMLQTIIKSYHLTIGHGGTSSELMAAIKRLFYFPKMRQVIKKYLNKCVPCRRKYGRPLKAHMGNLPVDFKSIQIFEKISLDFFGPVKVYRGKQTRGRKATQDFYVLVIVCMQIHALHLEMCEGMDTNQVLTALQRFVSRKRMPKLIRSDNFRSFESTQKIICPEFNLNNLNMEEIKDEMKIPTWEYTPPAASDQNLAETYVRLVKIRLDLDLKNRTFTRNELSTVLALAEDSVNNRPLSFMSDDVNDPIPITANKLLKPAFYSDLGININQNSPEQYRKHYEDLCSIVNQSFKRWMEEFTIAYQKYPKWKSWKENVKVGDLVIVIETNPLKQKDWSLGIITQTFPDERDQIVRKCLVRYKKSGEKSLSTYLRYTRNLIPLGLWHQPNDN